MFYRLRFDNAISMILDEFGMSDTDTKLAFWPTGYTPEWVKFEKSRGLNPTDAAAWAMCDLATRKVMERELQRSTGLLLCGIAQEHVRYNTKTSQAFLDQLQEYVDGVPLEGA